MYVVAALLFLSMPAVVVAVVDWPASFITSADGTFFNLHIVKGVKAWFVLSFPWGLFAFWGVGISYAKNQSLFIPVRLFALVSVVVLIVTNVHPVVVVLITSPLYVLLAAERIVHSLSKTEWRQKDVAFWFATFALPMYVASILGRVGLGVLAFVSIWLMMSVDYWAVNHRRRIPAKAIGLTALLVVGLAHMLALVA